MTSALVVEREGSVTRLTLNRPEKANALNEALVEGLIDAFAKAVGDDGSRLVVFSGAGRTFSAGFDFGGLERQSDGDLALRFLRIETLLQAVYHAPVATLALVHGACFGAAADLAAACSLRVVAPSARFRMPGLQFGIVLGTRRLAHVVGDTKARRLLEVSKTFEAEEALKMGFAHELMPEDTWSGVIQAARVSAEALPAASQQALMAQTVRDTRAYDMAALAASVSQPGLKARISAYLEGIKAR